MVSPPSCSSSHRVWPLDSNIRLQNNDRTEEALAFLEKYHGSGTRTAVVVKEHEQILRSVADARIKGLKRWDVVNLYNTRSNRYRTMLGEIPVCLG